MELVLLIGGIMIGSGITLFVTRMQAVRSKVGTLRIDRSDPDDQPYMFLELNKGVGDISTRTYVTLDVSTENYISQQ